MLNTDSRQRLMERHRGRCLHHKTQCRLSVLRNALPNKDFSDRPSTRSLIAAT
ncbi:hypothetical protein [Bacteroides acidifaciens]|uniref:hypothetical protein n=1 Tax=Bacteroides acidifaciens TaxID=85831 RepID=UPI00301546C6